MVKSWHQQFNDEITTALTARQKGKEAMARVCARRAANIVIKEYLSQHNVNPSTNVIQNLKVLKTTLQDDHSLQPIIEHLILKVSPDFTLPNDIDLIEDTIALRKILFPE